MSELKMAVLGAGHGGYTLAADMWLQGFEANLYEHPKFKENLEPVRERGGIEITKVPGGRAQVPRMGFAKINGILTTDMKEAIEDVDLINVVVPSFAQKTLFELLIPQLQDGQTVLIHTGNWGCLELRHMMEEKGVAENVKIAETQILIFDTRKWYVYMPDAQPATVTIGGYKERVKLAALPAKDTKLVLETVNKIYPEFVPANDVIETSASNTNLLHVPVMVLNAGILESRKGDFLFWKEGVSRSVGYVMEAMDKERCAVAKGIGTELKPFPEVEGPAFYGAKEFKSYDEYIHAWPQATTSNARKIWKEGFGDSPFKYRYIHEDVPYGLVPLASLGDYVNVPTPTLDALVHLASILSGFNYWKMGRTLDKLGLSGMTAQEILKCLRG